MANSGEKSLGLLTLEDYRLRAREVLSPEAWAFYDDATGRKVTYRASSVAFDRYVFRPRILRDVTKRSLSTTILGQPISMPICIAPSANHRYAHPEAEAATARGATDADTLFILSSLANVSIAEVGRSSRSGLKWMQLYLMKNQEHTMHIVKEAEKAGFQALVLTVDLPVISYYSFLINEDNATSRYYNDPSLRPVNLAIDLPEVHKAIHSGDTNIHYYLGTQWQRPMTWADVRWLKSMTSLPIVLKGILTGESAREASDAGVAGVIVSAHGGRALDGVPAPIDVLSEVVSAVKGQGLEVYLDGGVRCGTDVLKALAMGARAVFIGRPAIWGLACDGASGVKKVLSILRNEFDSSLGLAGCTGPHDIPESLVIRKSYL
ncbi:2-Hydroxyacid oxidase 1-like [Diadema antillarum]|uniref:2-Hydroxyacid oxidase 1-like n=1 Tax=Diadema antillarum TaxID=105358 RepID=UPI003A886C53